MQKTEQIISYGSWDIPRDEKISRNIPWAKYGSYLCATLACIASLAGGIYWGACLRFLFLGSF